MALSFLVVLLRTQSLTRACKTTSVQYIGVEDVDVVAAVVRGVFVVPDAAVSGDVLQRQCLFVKECTLES